MNNSSKPSLSKEQKFVIASTATVFLLKTWTLISCHLHYRQSLPVLEFQPSKLMDHNDHPVGRSFRRIAVRSFK